jgi:hypothetical protein
MIVGDINDMARPAEWRRFPVSPYQSYEVSDCGRVRRNGRDLVGDIDRQGYRTVNLSYAGLKRRFKVSRMVCEAFHGPAPDGAHAAHLDGNPRNNAAANLQWKSAAENNADKLLHGTHQAGAKHPQAKLTPDDVAEIRACTTPHRTLARQMGISDGTVRKIRKGDRWKS